MALMDMVIKLEGKNDLQRRGIILDWLKSRDYNFRLERYDTGIEKGVNVVLQLNQGKNEILATAHYDVVAGSPGANDNASSISVLLDVYERMLEHKTSNSVKFIIFDDEEPTDYRKECVGSREYIKRHGLENLIAVYNLELCGMGDMVGIWPVTRDVEKSFALANLRETLRSLDVYFEEVGYLPDFYSDHSSFREFGFKDAFCLTAAPREEKDAIRKFAKSSSTKLILNYFLSKFSKKFQQKIPLLFRCYHTPEDKSKYLSESSLWLMSKVLYNAIVNLDRNKKE